MHYAIEVVPFGDYANPRHVIPLAQAAEAAGWEGLLIAARRVGSTCAHTGTS